MMKRLLPMCCALVCATLLAGETGIKSSRLTKPLKVRWKLEQLTSPAGADETYKTVTPAGIGVKMQESCTARGEAADIKITLKNTTGKPLFIRVTATADIPFENFTWWNGYLNNNVLQFDPADKPLSTWFPANAAISNKTAVILGLDPMLLCSRVDSGQAQSNGTKQLLVALPVYLEPGKSFAANFTAAVVPAQFGYHDVVQAWYDLFPQAFRPPAEISKDVISGEASYVYWTPNKFAMKFPSDMLRRYYGGRGCWEWCYKPFIRAGDWAISDQYSVGWRNYSKERVENHRKNISKRLAPAAFQSVAPMWYLNVCWTEWTIWKNHFPGLEYHQDNRMRRCWSQDVIYGIYCYGTAYADLFKESMTNVAKNFPAAKGIGWDSCFAHRQIPATHAGFKGTNPKSFEKGVPMVLEAVGISDLLDHNHKNFAGGKRMANAVNFKLVSPFMIGVRADAGLYEGHPMGDPKRLLRVEAMRSRLGSPKAVVWHKHAFPERMKWIDWDDMTRAEAQDAYRQTMDNILFLSYYWGCISAPGMPAFGVKNLVDAAPELVDLVRLGWQPSPAVIVPDQILAARYGSGAGAKIVLINPDFKARKFNAVFPAAYWENSAAFITGRPNQPVVATLNASGTTAEITLPARSLTVLNVCGLVKLDNKLTVSGEQVCEAGKAPIHRFLMKTTKFFTAEARFAKKDAAAPVRISCEEDVIRFKKSDAVKYTLNTKNWPGDVQAANLLTASLSLVEYQVVSAAEMDKETIAALNIPAKAKAGKVFISAAPEIRDEAERVAEWVRFYTHATTGNYAEPVINGTPGTDAVVIKLEVNSDELKNYQTGRAFVEDNTIRIVCSAPEHAKNITLAALNALDAAYPYYGTLPDTPGLKKIGLAGKTLLPAPVKTPLRPTLLEMMKRCKIK